MFLPFGSLVDPVGNEPYFLLTQRGRIQWHPSGRIGMPQTLHYFAALTVTGDDGGFPRFRRRFGLFFKKQAESPRLFDTSVAGNTFGVDNWTDIPVVTYGPLLLAASGGKNRSQDKKGQYGLFSTGQHIYWRGQCHQIYPMAKNIKM